MADPVETIFLLNSKGSEKKKKRASSENKQEDWVVYFYNVKSKIEFN